MKKNELPINVKTYTVEELAAIFNKSRGTIYNWMELGILPYRQFPGERRFTVEDLNELNKNLLVKSTTKKSSLQAAA